MKLKQNILLIGIIVILAIPTSQYYFKFFDTGKMVELFGDFQSAADIDFTIKGYFSGDYQEKKEKYLNDNFGFRSYAIRVNNELSFDLYKKTTAKEVVIGKEDYLYEEHYINAFFGLDFIGIDSISAKLSKVKAIQDTLEKLGKSLMVIYAPGKGTFYPQYFPEKYDDYKRGETNLESFVRISLNKKINFIDFNSYFVKIKDISPYPLYPKFGIHWSIYGACLAGDSVISYIEQMRQVELPHMRWEKIEKEKAKHMDYDIGAGLNLLIQLDREEMAYPVLHREKKKASSMLNVLTVGDSFYMAFVQQGISSCFNKNHFWYYNNEVYSTENNDIKKINDAKNTNITEEINNHDVFMIMSSDCNLSEIGWGFIERVYNHFYPNNN
jgi:hypothetical protein